MADDFSEQVKRILALRVGNLCSNPECRALTSGPQDDPAKAVNVGVAAHITAASLGGARYDSEILPGDRSGPENGIWLCQNDAKLIDNDAARFTVDLLRKWKSDAEAEAKSRVGRTAGVVAEDVFMDISVMNEDTSSWNRGEETILRYSLDKNDHGIKIECQMGYLDSFKRGGPIVPLNYVSPTYCPFKWDFPNLDFKVLNVRETPLFLTEVVFDIEESRPDLTPLLTIKRDTHQRFAGELHIVNEGWCALTDLNISFQLLPGAIAAPANILPPYAHTIPVALLEDHVEVDVTNAFQEEGVDIEGLIRLSNGKWDQDTFVAPKADNYEERMTDTEMRARWETYLGRFKEEVGTLVGEISFKAFGDVNNIEFHAPVYLVNKNRSGLMKPPSYQYGVTLDVENTNYQRRVQISHTLQPGEADRFTVRVAVAQSSFHRFRATIRDVTGLTLQSLPIEMNCFIPRSRRNAVGNAITSVRKV